MSTSPPVATMAPIVADAMAMAQRAPRSPCDPDSHRPAEAPAAASFQERRRRLLPPLPIAGLYLDWRPAPKVTLAGRADYLSLKVDDENGRLINAQASAAYEVARGLDLGLMWRHVNYRPGVSREDWSGQVSYRFTGPMAFVTCRFGS